jgi:hypothetical protein
MRNFTRVFKPLHAHHASAKSTPTAESIIMQADFTFTDEEGNVTVITRATGVARSNGIVFHHPRVLVENNGGFSMKTVLRRQLKRTDYSKIVAVDTTEGSFMTILFSDDTEYFLRVQKNPPATLLGNKRCS